MANCLVFFLEYLRNKLVLSNSTNIRRRLRFQVLLVISKRVQSQLTSEFRLQSNPARFIPSDSYLPFNSDTQHFCCDNKYLLPVNHGHSAIANIWPSAIPTTFKLPLVPPAISIATESFHDYQRLP